MKETLKWATPYNYEYEAQKVEENSGEIVTVPDESYSIRELMQRATEGMPLPHRLGEYDGSDDFDTVSDETARPDFDLTDAKNLNDYLAAKMKKSKQKTSAPIQEAVEVKEGSVADDQTENDSGNGAQQ